MIILGIESSCDETGVALVCTKRGLLSHALHSQIDLHQQYGGVVPELASRDHIRRVIPLMQQVFTQAGLQRTQINAVAYTAGPGLAGALLVGASIAQSLAWSLNLPAVAIHHLEGHLLSPRLATPRPEFPFVALLVSGGHTQLMKVEAVGRYQLLGETLDDAAGEAFDKSAKLMGLGYPGGPALAACAQQGNASRFKLPRPLLHRGTLDFSFSGLKTAVLMQIKKINQAQNTLDTQTQADLAASIEQAIVDVLIHKSIQALNLTGLRRLVVAGGVGANQSLRTQLTQIIKDREAEVFFPPQHLCTDNGAMIAFAACERFEAGIESLELKPYTFTVRPRWELTEV